MCPGGSAAMDAQWGVRALVQKHAFGMTSASTGAGSNRGGSSLERGATMTEERRWYAGVDWASETHYASATDDLGQNIGERIFARGGAGLAEMASWLTARSGAPPAQIHIADPCRLKAWGFLIPYRGL